jgi:hypothetical protein
VGLTVRISAAMVLGMVLLGDWLLGTGPDRRDDSHVVAEMIRMITYGTEHRDAPGPMPPVGPASPASTEGRAVMAPTPGLAMILDRLADAERRAAVAEHELARLRLEVSDKSS